MNALPSHKFLIKTIIVLMYSLPLGGGEMSKTSILNLSTLTPTPTRVIPDEPEYVVIEFIEAIGNKDLGKAYSLQNVKAFGTFKDFSSSKIFGAVTKTKVHTFSNIGCTNKNCTKVKVWVHYLKIVPLSNKTVYGGNMKENFYVAQQNGVWKIVDVKRA